MSKHSRAEKHQMWPMTVPEQVSCLPTLICSMAEARLRSPQTADGKPTSMLPWQPRTGGEERLPGAQTFLPGLHEDTVGDGCRCQMLAPPHPTGWLQGGLEVTLRVGQ